MSEDRPRVMAAPNRCRVQARVVEVRPSAGSGDKVDLRVEIRTSEALEGANFARVGQVVDAFTFAAPPGLAAGATVQAEAEYLGDARSGRFQLYGPKVVDAPRSGTP